MLLLVYVDQDSSLYGIGQIAMHNLLRLEKAISVRNDHR
jgi:hypothetical protein